MTSKRFYIAGVKFRPESDLRVVMTALRDTPVEDAPINLVGEPSNSFDKEAVKVILFGRHIGYVPKPLNSEVWKKREEGFKPVVRLVKFSPGDPTYEMFTVEINFVPESAT